MATAALTTQVCAETTTPGPPNILFVMPDDHGVQAISAYGTLMPPNTAAALTLPEQSPWKNPAAATETQNLQPGTPVPHPITP